MNIAVIGMGLIGGSMARAISRFTPHKVFGFDIKKEVTVNAIVDGVIKTELNKDNIKDCDVMLVALYPDATISTIKEYAPFIKKGSLVVDLCGIKEKICKSCNKIAQEYGFVFLGGHPMAGIEKWGYAYSTPLLFEGASMILIPPDEKAKEMLPIASELFLSLGFGRIKVSTAKEHDKVIACTSQLAHVVSSCYAKSPTAKDFYGFTAGSFKDMTRVAVMNEKMWTELFLQNSDNLINEIDYLTKHLNDYKQALTDKNEEKVLKLIKEGTKLKQAFDRREQ